MEHLSLCGLVITTTISMEVEMLYFVQDWFEDNDFAGVRRRLTATSHLESRSIRKDNLNYVRRAHRRLQSCSLRMALHELRIERLWFCELPDGIFQSHHHPTKVTRTTSIMETRLIEPTNQRSQLLQRASSTTIIGARIIVSNGSTMARSSAIFRIGTVTRRLGPIRVPQLAVATSEPERCSMSKSQQCRKVEYQAPSN